MTQTAEQTERHLDLQPLGPDSLTWQDFGSWRFHLMLPQAFVLQVAHPIIDAGVGEHSVYKTDPWGRAKRSTELLWPIVYARPQRAIEMGVKLYDLHRSIKGVDKQGKKYFALDPEAYSWVHITGYDATIRMHEFYGTSPTTQQRHEMFAEWRQLGKLMGIRDKDLPATESEYWDYFHGMIRDKLEWGDVVQDLMRPEHYLEISKPPNSKIPDAAWRMILAVMGRFMRFNLRATLPVTFREKFQIPWTTNDERLFRLWCGTYRAMHTLTPKKWRLIPLARNAYTDAQRHPEAYNSNN
ncbi:MAG: oxygenase MpaB family protein [Alloalcanivorax sp.]